MSVLFLFTKYLSFLASWFSFRIFKRNLIVLYFILLVQYPSRQGEGIQLSRYTGQPIYLSLRTSRYSIIFLLLILGLIVWGIPCGTSFYWCIRTIRQVFDNIFPYPSIAVSMSSSLSLIILTEYFGAWTCYPIRDSILCRCLNFCHRPLFILIFSLTQSGVLGIYKLVWSPFTFILIWIFEATQGVRCRWNYMEVFHPLLRRCDEAVT